MADIFGNVQPPAWLERLTQPSEPGMLGKIFGDLVGGLANASEDAIKSATDKQSQGIETNWIKELPGSIKGGLAEARLNATNPLWRIQAQQAQLNIAAQKLGLDSAQQKINMQKQQMAQWEQDAPKLSAWMSLPFDERATTPIDVRSQPALDIVQKTTVADARQSFSTSANKLVSDYAAGLAEVTDPALKAQLIPRPNGRPTPQQIQGLDIYLKANGKPALGEKAEPTAIRVGREIARLQDEVDAATAAGDIDAAQSAQNQLDALKSQSKQADQSLYSKAPEVIEVEGKKFLKWGKQLRDLSGSSAKDKAEISIMTDKIKKLQDEIIKNPDDDTLKTQLNAARSQFKKFFESKSAAPATKPAATPTVTTQQQFDALPSGATYIGKDGKTYRKP